MASVDRILMPYVRRREPGVIARSTFFMLLLFVGIVYGLMAALLPPSMLMVPGFPIVVLAVLCLWMLPDIGPVRIRPMATSLLWFAAVFSMWPNYVAVSLPGLPWITPQRLAVGVLLIYFLSGISMSSDFRGKVYGALKGVPILHRLFWAFWLLTAISLVFSRNPVSSLNKFVNNQIFWTMLLLISAYLASFPGFASRFVRVSMIGLIVSLMLALYEMRIEKVFWVEHLPAILRVDPALLAKAIEAQSRAGTDVYRVRGTMLVSLYFAEYLAMLFPLLIHAILNARTPLHKFLLALVVIPMLVVMVGTNARSAIVGMLLTMVVYFLFLVLRKRKRNPGSIMAMAGVMAYPAGVAALGLAVVFWRRLHVMVLGGGQHQASSDARAVQWQMGFPKALKWPLGQGPGQAADVLNFTNLGGELTIDTYYLSILLEYGLLALPLFLLCFAVPVWLTYRHFNQSHDQETDLIMPLAAGLFNFLIIKAVLSSESNMPLAFVMLGLFVGLLSRIMQGNGPDSHRQFDDKGYEAGTAPQAANLPARR